MCLRGQNLPSDFGFLLTAGWVCLRDGQEATLLVTLEKSRRRLLRLSYSIAQNLFAIQQRESWGGLWVSSQV